MTQQSGEPLGDRDLEIAVQLYSVMCPLDFITDKSALELAREDVLHDTETARALVTRARELCGDEALQSILQRLDAMWSRDCPQGPDGRLRDGPGRIVGCLDDECRDIWRDVRAALERKPT